MLFTTYTQKTCHFDLGRRSVLNRLLLLGCMLLVSIMFSCNAYAQNGDVFSTSYFDVKLTNGWEVQGRPQNSMRALNVNFVNNKRNVKINVIVGSAVVSPEEQLESLRDGLRQQGALVHKVRTLRNIKYFTFTLGQWPGFCYSGTNGRDLSIIVAVGNRTFAASFIRSFYNRDTQLFPPF